MSDKQIQLMIDGQQVSVADGSTVLDAVESIGGNIPTLCHLDGCEKFTSCMVCQVKDLKTGKFLPACSAPALAGMELDTKSDDVKQIRRDALELLLSEHLGDCEAPCRQICPAFMNIPQMLRQIIEGHHEAALQTAKQRLALPGVLGRICHAPCEKGCRRARHDQGVAIRSIVGGLALHDAESGTRYVPECQPDSGHKVAIIGAGPTGLSAAYYLRREGHACTIFDENEKLGGKLRYGCSEGDLPRAVLDADIDAITTLGVELCLSTKVDAAKLVELDNDYGAVVIAIGRDNDGLGLEKDEEGLVVDETTFETKMKNVFAGGGALLDSQQTVRSVADGHSIATIINDLFAGVEMAEHRPYNHRHGKLIDGDMQMFLKEADSRERAEVGEHQVLTGDDAGYEASRCLHCDCRKPSACKLRKYASEYGAKQTRFKADQRLAFERRLDHPDVVYEPGKCIRCGLCVRISARHGEKIGLGFQSRGFATEVAVPFSESLAAGLTDSVRDCVESCPTGALAFRHGEER